MDSSLMIFAPPCASSQPRVVTTQMLMDHIARRTTTRTYVSDCIDDQVLGGEDSASNQTT